MSRRDMVYKWLLCQKTKYQALQLCLYFKAVVIKHLEQTNDCEAAQKSSVFWGKHPKVEIAETGNYASNYPLS
jgi:hypothetical protein